MFFDELSNDEWVLLAALVSDEPAVRLNRRGRPRAEPRIVANAVLWILTTGEPWSKLPGRYPSGPTCRRRFEEWQLNGTLLEMVRLLSQTGRTFAYVPQPVQPSAAKPVTQVSETPNARDESLRGVSWKSPETWQAPGVSSNLSHWRSAGPIADITRQLSGLANAVPAPAPLRRETVFANMPAAVPLYAPVPPMQPAAPVARSAVPMRSGPAWLDEADAIGAAMDALDSAIASYRHAQAPHEQRRPVSMSFEPRGTRIDVEHGYVIYIAAEQVPDTRYRAWAEIMKDGKRVERSGLVGPRFDNAQEAEQLALDWARQWIDRDCRTLAEASAMAGQAHAPLAETAQAPAMPVARQLPPMRHVPEPAAVNHGAPLQGPLNAFRGPLRRYPGEPVAATTATECSASECYPSYPELISHAG